MVRRPARLQPDLTDLDLAQEPQELLAPQHLAQHHLLLVVDAMQLEAALRCVDSDPCYRGHGRLPWM
jgi:hypothetical protein